MNILWFLLGMVVSFIIIVIISFVAAYKEHNARYKIMLEDSTNHYKTKIEPTKKPVGRPKKNVKKGE